MSFFTRLFLIIALSLIHAMQCSYSVEPGFEQLVTTNTPSEPDSTKTECSQSDDLTLKVENVEKFETIEEFGINEEKNDSANYKPNVEINSLPSKKKTSLTKLAAYVGLPVFAGVGIYFIAKENLKDKESAKKVNDKIISDKVIYETKDEQTCKWIMTKCKEKCRNKLAQSAGVPSKATFNIVVVASNQQDANLDNIVSEIAKDDRFKGTCAIQVWSSYTSGDANGNAYENENPNLEYKSSNLGTYITVPAPIHSCTLKALNQNPSAYNWQSLWQYFARLYAATLYMANSKNRNVVVLRSPNTVMDVDENFQNIYLKNRIYGRNIIRHALTDQTFQEALNITKCRVLFLCDSYDCECAGMNWNESGPDYISDYILQNLSADINKGRIEVANDPVGTINSTILLELDTNK